MFKKEKKITKFPQEEDVKYRHIFGSIAVPDGKAGFICILGVTRELGYQGKPKLIVLDGYETHDLQDLVEQMAFLDLQYCCNKWFGNNRDHSLNEFIRDLNESTSDAEYLKQNKDCRALVLSYPRILLAKEKPYTAMIPRLNTLLGGQKKSHGQQRLFIRYSPLTKHLKGQQVGEADTLQFGDLPSLDALCFIISDILNNERPNVRPPQTKTKSWNVY